MKFSCRLLLIIISIILTVLSFPLPDMWYLAWIALVPAIIGINRAGFKAGLLLGMIFGFSFMALIGSWLKIFGIEPLVLGSFYWGLFYALFFSIWGWYSTKIRAGIHWQSYVIPPALWTAAEWLKTQGVFGFCLGMLGLTQHKFLYLIQIASVCGVYGITFLIVFCNNLLAQLIMAVYERGEMTGENPWKGFPRPAFRRGIITLFNRILGEEAENKSGRLAVIAFVGLFSAVLVIGRFSIPYQINYGDYEEIGGRKISVGVVQPNMSQDIKWKPESLSPTLNILKKRTRETAEKKADLVIWPETAIPHSNPLGNEDLRRFLFEQASINGVLLVTGLIERTEDKVYNSAILIDPQNQLIGTHRKTRLVPMAEYLPLPESFRKYRIFDRTGNYSQGGRPSVFKTPDWGFGVLICFESMFDFLPRHFVAEGAHFLVSITNDAWFLRSNMAKTHFIMGRFRAVENRVWFIQSANTGVSGIVDPWGIIRKETEIFKQEAFVENIYVRPSRTIYNRLGNWLPALCFILCIILLRIPVKKPDPVKTEKNSKMDKEVINNKDGGKGEDRHADMKKDLSINESPEEKNDKDEEKSDTRTKSKKRRKKRGRKPDSGEAVHGNKGEANKE